MTYIENVFACIAAPLLVAALCAGKKHAHFFIFALAGMLSCLLSAYVNTFFAALLDVSALGATAEIAPVVEEAMKLMPLLFYLLVFEPEGDRIRSAILATAAGFATFENVCYLLENGAEDLGFFAHTRLRHGRDARHVRRHSRLRHGVRLAARGASRGGKLRAAGYGGGVPRGLQPHGRLRRPGAVRRLCAAASAARRRVRGAAALRRKGEN